MWVRTGLRGLDGTLLSHNPKLELTLLLQQDCVSKLGGSCDVFRAWSTKHLKKVAVKQIREFMGENVSFAKVCLVK